MADFSLLNARQLEVATTLDRNVLLLAPAGTGKTNTLAYRIAGIIDARLALPEEILCLTFTNKACREMQERIVRVAGDDGARVAVRTFHSFCYDVIKTEAKRRSDIFSDFTIYDEKDCESFIERLAERERMVAAPGTLKRLIDKLKTWRAELAYYTDDLRADYARTLARVLEERPEALQKIAVDRSYKFMPQVYEEWVARGADFTARYDQFILEQHGLDFTDLIAETRRLFLDSEVVLKWSRRFSYINIDEVQDTSELEFSILEQLFGSNRLLLAGDYFQTIYEWRGTNPERVLQRYQADYAPVTIALTENYRSTQTLLNASFQALEQLFPARVEAVYPSGLRSVSAELGAPIVLKAAEDIGEEARWIYDTIAQLPIEDYSRVCVLTRTNNYNRALSDYFTRLGSAQGGIPFMLIDDAKFFRRKEIKDVLAVLKVIVNKNDTPSLTRVLREFGDGIGQETIKKLTSDRYRRAGLRLTDFLDSDARRDGDPFAVLTRALRAGQVVVFDVESTGIDTTRDEIVQIAGIRLDASGGVAEKFVRYLRPTRSVGDSVRVHHIEDKFLAESGEEARLVLAEFTEFARGAVIVGHNVTYDLKILASQLARLELAPLEYTSYYDTLDIYRRFYPNLPNHKLEFLGSYFAVEHKSSHDALDDILATAELLLRALRVDIEPGESERRELMAASYRRFTQAAERLATFRALLHELHPPQLLTHIIRGLAIDEKYKKRGEENRLANLRDLYRQARALDDPGISALDATERLLAYSALSTSDFEAANRTKIPIITVHQAKGSEFDYVFVAGLQAGVFPMFNARAADKLAEEARLFYVAITRAKKQLFLSWSRYDNARERQMSPFLNTIPRDYIQYA